MNLNLQYMIYVFFWKIIIYSQVASVNISPPTNIPASLSTWEALKIVAPFVQKILDSASTSFQLKIKEAMHILWEQPSFNSQVKHLNFSLSY